MDLDLNILSDLRHLLESNLQLMHFRVKPLSSTSLLREELKELPIQIPKSKICDWYLDNTEECRIISQAFARLFSESCDSLVKHLENKYYVHRVVIIQFFLDCSLSNKMLLETLVLPLKKDWVDLSMFLTSIESFSRIGYESMVLLNHDIQNIFKLRLLKQKIICDIYTVVFSLTSFALNSDIDASHMHLIMKMTSRSDKIFDYPIHSNKRKHINVKEFISIVSNL